MDDYSYIKKIDVAIDHLHPLPLQSSIVQNKTFGSVNNDANAKQFILLSSDIGHPVKITIEITNMSTIATYSNIFITTESGVPCVVIKVPPANFSLAYYELAVLVEDTQTNVKDSEIIQVYSSINLELEYDAKDWLTRKAKAVRMGFPKSECGVTLCYEEDSTGLYKLTQYSGTAKAISARMRNQVQIDFSNNALYRVKFELYDENYQPVGISNGPYLEIYYIKAKQEKYIGMSPIFGCSLLHPPSHILGRSYNLKLFLKVMLINSNGNTVYVGYITITSRVTIPTQKFLMSVPRKAQAAIRRYALSYK